MQDIPIKNAGTEQYPNWVIENTSIRHNSNGPAEITANGRKLYYRFGLLHREDGPAIDDPINGDQMYYNYGNYHRIDGPAYTRRSGDETIWYVHNKPHRIDGPAHEYQNNKTYYLFGNSMSKETFDKLVALEGVQQAHREFIKSGKLPSEDSGSSAVPMVLALAGLVGAGGVALARRAKKTEQVKEHAEQIK